LIFRNITNAVPPVCKVVDYQNFYITYEGKGQKANKSNVVVKEIRFGPQTDVTIQL
jgi:translation initiation factor IF-3